MLGDSEIALKLENRPDEFWSETIGIRDLRGNKPVLVLIKWFTTNDDNQLDLSNFKILRLITYKNFLLSTVEFTQTFSTYRTSKFSTPLLFPALCDQYHIFRID